MRCRPAALIASSAVVLSLSVSAAVPATAAHEVDESTLPEMGRSAAPEGTSNYQKRRQLDAAAQAVADGGAVGVTARVDSPDFAWRGAAGTRELEGTARAQPIDRFRVGSITKTMVATLVMQEVQAGTLTLDTPVNEVVEDLFPAHPDVTVEQLLSHRSGAPTGTDALLLAHIQDPTSWEQFIAAVGRDYTAAEHLAVVNGAPWPFEPGSAFGYSNAGYIALGMVLEELTGEDLDDLLEDRIFDEAGMYRTTYPDEPNTQRQFLVDAMWTGEAADGGIGWVSLEGFDPDVFGAAGAVVSTTADLNLFTEALADGDLVDPDLVTEMITPRSSDPVEYGLGIYRIADPCTGPGEPPAWLYGHNGATYGTLSVALTSPDGDRQITLGTTGRNLTSADPLYDVNALLEPMVLATCED